MYRTEQLSHNRGSTGRAKTSYTKVNALAGLQGDSCTRLFHAATVQSKQLGSNETPHLRHGLQKHFSGHEPDSGAHHLEQLLVACTGFLIRESRLHIEFHAEHRAPGGEVLEQHHAAFCFANHDSTAGLRAVNAADQFEAVNVITFGAASHVLNQLGVSSLLPFDLWELPSDVVELHLFSKVKPPSSTEILNATQCRRPQPASGAQTTSFCQVSTQNLQPLFRCSNKITNIGNNFGFVNSGRLIPVIPFRSCTSEIE